MTGVILCDLSISYNFTVDYTIGSKIIFYSSLEEEIENLHVKRSDIYVIDTAKYEDILSTLKLKKGEACERGLNDT